MKKVISSERVPIKMWLDNIEEGALNQLKNLANLPFAFKHISAMPDCHFGYGMPIGSVIATDKVIIPNAVGKDIGCGMCVVKTSLNELSQDDLKKIMSEIRKAIPVGFKSRDEKVSEDAMPEKSMPLKNIWSIVSDQYEHAREQLGTLGSGNHFIEIQKSVNQDINGNIWIMLHSGSRNLGSKVAVHYDKIAKELNNRWYSKIETSVDLAFLPIETVEARNYMLEMDYCLAFAKKNREYMMNIIMDIFQSIVPCSFKYFHDIHHNYAVWENHFGRNVIVHRKGATSAREGEMGIIPGSQGTSSYIVEGLGNADSFNSCSHGAGRAMGKRDAKRRLNLEKELEILNSKGILHTIRSADDLDEATGAYKDIYEVMENQKDLVDIVTELTPIGVIKG